MIVPARLLHSIVRRSRELAACSKRACLFGDAPLLAERDSILDPARRRRQWFPSTNQDRGDRSQSFAGRATDRILVRSEFGSENLSDHRLHGGGRRLPQTGLCELARLTGSRSSQPVFGCLYGAVAKTRNLATYALLPRSSCISTPYRLSRPESPTP